VRIYWNKSKCTIQIKDDDPETLTRTQFREKYVNPAVLFFNADFTRVQGTEKMLNNFFNFCEEELGDNLSNTLGKE
jgi:hypothetical protein